MVVKSKGFKSLNLEKSPGSTPTFSKTHGANELPSFYGPSGMKNPGPEKGYFSITRGGDFGAGMKLNLLVRDRAVPRFLNRTDRLAGLRAYSATVKVASSAFY